MKNTKELLTVWRVGVTVLLAIALVAIVPLYTMQGAVEDPTPTPPPAPPTAGNTIEDGRQASLSPDKLDDPSNNDVPVATINMYSDSVGEYGWGYDKTFDIPGGSNITNYEIISCQVGWTNLTNSGVRSMDFLNVKGQYSTSGNSVIQQIPATVNYNPSVVRINSAENAAEFTFDTPLDFDNHNNAFFMDLIFDVTPVDNLQVNTRTNIYVAMCTLRLKSNSSLVHDVYAFRDTLVYLGDRPTSSSSSSATSSNPGTNDAAAIAFYRFYNPVTQAHLYTASSRDRDTLVAQYADTFVYEREKNKVFPNSETGSELVQVYQIYDSVSLTHRFTTDVNAYNNASGRYFADGAKFKAYNSPGTGREAFTEYYNTRTTGYFYTSKQSERDALETRPEFSHFRKEGDIFYVLPW